MLPPSSASPTRWAFLVCVAAGALWFHVPGSGAVCAVELREPKALSQGAPAALQGQGSCLELGGSPKGIKEGDFTEGFEFMHRFQVADNSRLILMNKVLTSLFVVRWQYLLKLPQLQKHLGFRSLLFFICLYH